MLSTSESGKLEPTPLVSETIDIHQVPDRLEAMTGFGTVGIPVCNDFTA